MHLNSALSFARKFATINDDDIRIIKHTCNSVLTYNEKQWVKKDQTSSFDVPMGSYFGAELCDLIGLHILDKLSGEYETGQIGLYRDDGLGIIRCINNQHLENKKKRTIKIIKDIGFNITIDVGMTKCNFLDITLDLANKCHMPYKKENSSVIYINKNSNHPTTIKKNLPRMIEERLARLSTNINIFNNAKPCYQNALNNSNFKHKLEYVNNTKQNENKKRKRTRNVLFYNPPFCQSVRTNIGKKFLELIDKHFRSETMKKIFNRNNCKISYCCMDNIKSIINRHNKRTLKNANAKKAQEEPKCNCRANKPCPLDGNCLQNNVVYKATVTTDSDTKDYIGSTGGSFKTRWYAHTSDFKNEKKNGTELSKYIWNLKNKNTNYEIKWSIMHKIGELSNINRICKTCNLEKMEIALANKKRNLNKRQELFFTCPHFRKFYFKT